MGLIVAKRLFPVFNISFYDEKENEVPFNPGKVVGTRINMGIRWKDV